MFLVMFDSKKHRDLFPSDDGNLAVKELAWTALKIFPARAAKQVGNEGWLAVNPATREEESLFLAQPTWRCYRLGNRPAHPEQRQTICRDPAPQVITS